MDHLVKYVYVSVDRRREYDEGDMGNGGDGWDCGRILVCSVSNALSYRGLLTRPEVTVS